MGAENIDAVGLAESANFARVMHRDFFRDHDDLAQTRIDPDQLGNTVAHARWRQIDNAGIEGEAIVEPFANIIVDRNIPRRGRQHLAASSRRSSEHHIAAGESMTDRRHLP